MKQFTIILALIITTAAFCQDKGTSTTSIRIQGVYIFIESEPNTEYEILKTERYRVDFGNDPSKDFEKVIKKAKKDFPELDALIFRLNKKRRADLIKFKDKK